MLLSHWADSTRGCLKLSKPRLCNVAIFTSLAKILGHSNIKMTERYAKLAQQHIVRTSNNTVGETWEFLERAAPKVKPKALRAIAVSNYDMGGNDSSRPQYLIFTLNPPPLSL